MESTKTFLRSLGEEHYLDVFYSNGLDFDSLMSLSSDELETIFDDIGLPRGLRLKILTRVHILKAKGE